MTQLKEKGALCRAPFFYITMLSYKTKQLIEQAFGDVGLEGGLPVGLPLDIAFLGRAADDAVHFDDHRGFFHFGSACIVVLSGG